MIPIESVIILQDDLWPVFIIWKIWHFKMVKLFHQFLTEHSGDLITLVFVIVLGWLGSNHMLDSF
jgi:hypothetical protein